MKCLLRLDISSLVVEYSLMKMIPGEDSVDRPGDDDEIDLDTCAGNASILGDNVDRVTRSRLLSPMCLLVTARP